jgi:hypothetical protein
VEKQIAHVKSVLAKPALVLPAQSNKEIANLKSQSRSFGSGFNSFYPQILYENVF